MGAGKIHGQRKGAHQSDAERPVAIAALAEAVGQVQGQRPDQVELLFHRQRPGVQQGQGAGFRCKVLAQFLEIVDVAQAHQGGQPALGKDVVGIADIEGRDHQEGDRGHQQEQGHQSADTAGVKIAKPEGAFFKRPLQKLGDHKPGNDKEHIHTDKTAGDAGNLIVIENHQDNGQRT